MISTVQMLDAARQRLGDVSDYRLAKVLGVNPNAVSNYRVGRSCPSNPIAMRLAALAGVDGLEAVVAVNIERAQTPEDRHVWEKMLERVTPTPKRKTGH
jgi:predicted transcriptional regulator